MSIKEKIKEAVYSNKVTETAYNLTRKGLSAIEYSVLSLIGKSKPIRNNKVVAGSYCGRGYGDNAKAVIDELFKICPDVDVVMPLNQSHFDDELPEGIRRVEYGSVAHFLELSTAKVWIDNMRMLFGPDKRKEQVYFQMWHGPVMLKRVEKDAVLSDFYVKKAKQDSRNADYFISSGKFESYVYRSAFWYDGEILENGTPRLDRFINKEIKKEYYLDILKKFGLDIETRIVLYAPTFRENDESVYDLDYQRLEEALTKQFGGKWVVMVRFHPNVSEKFRDYAAEKRNIINVTSYPDLYDLLPVTDVLITDYSSVMFEFSMVGKTVFLYASDIDKYIQNERDFYFTFKELPYSLAQNNDELIKIIEEFDSSVYNEKVHQFFDDKLGLNETGHSAEIIAGMIKDIIERG